MSRHLVFLIFAVISTSQLFAQNAVKIFETSSRKTVGPCEPSIAINPGNPAQMVAGSVLNFVHYSADSGKTWQTNRLTSPHGVWGDPCIVADGSERFYYFHLSDPSGKNYQSEEILDRIVCQSSDDGGKTWNEGGYMGFHHPKDQDKEWAAVDLKTNRLICTWTQFDKYKSTEPGDHSNILFSTSIDRGQSWSEAKVINQFPGNCLDDAGTTEGAVPAFGPSGEIYVAWALNENIYFDRSSDHGNTWMDKDIVVALQKGGWRMDIPGWGRCNGMPVTACDVSNSKFRGNLYVCWADIKSGTNNSDVWISVSKNGGLKWSKPIRLNNDKSETHQFLPWMTVDPVTGVIYAVFYDRRNYSDEHTDVYLAWSKDGGKKWHNEKINESGFLPDPDYFMGDYNNISAYNGVVRPVWTELRNGKLSIWTALIQEAY